MQQIFNVFPPYLFFLTVILVILPTIFAIFLRYSLYRHLHKLNHSIELLLRGNRQQENPAIINKLNQKLQENNANLDQINTLVIIDSAYNKEKIKFLFKSFSCEASIYFGRIIPNLLLSFGLLGTFLGITINLTNLSQTITQVDINNVRNLVEELNQPLQGMGIAFITSLIAIACSALLTILNLIWNANLAKVELLSLLEDYVDNIYLAPLKSPHPMEKAIDRLNQDFSNMLYRLGDTIEASINDAFARVEKSAYIFQQAANSIENSRFSEKLASATTDLSIAQNQFSQSSLVLQKSTQSFEHSLDSFSKLSRQLLAINQRINNIQEQYNTLLTANQQKNIVEAASLKEIQQELAKLIEHLQSS
ncbi:MAG: methyl-accepting chemotaxis protein [Xenococcaceae cyanobacterium]